MGREGTVIVHRLSQQRDEKAPTNLNDYDCKVEWRDQILANVDYCYRVMYNVPQTFKEAMSSSKSEIWTSTIKEEIDTLRENSTVTSTTLPEGKM